MSYPRRRRLPIPAHPRSRPAGRGWQRVRRHQTPAAARPSSPVPAARWLQALTFGVLIVYAAFFALSFNRSGPGDSDQYLVFHRLQYWNHELFGIAKQWTPVMCSGLSMAGEPQIPFMSLSMALSYALGPLWGVKAALVIYLALGWAGAFLYAGLWLRIALQRSLAASLFVGNGFFFCRYGMGHFDFVPFLVLPLMLWTLHRCVDWRVAARSAGEKLRLPWAVLLGAAATALVVDGSPVGIIHLMFWIGLYACVLSVHLRNATPIAVLACALVIAAVLDAGYLWPMLQSQAAFPRRTADSFTSALSLIWFAILPMRGKVLPAHGNGHELSVYIGPVLAWCMWNSRHWLRQSLPATLRAPLLAVGVTSVVLGMGSLKLLHLPGWLSPFDLLRVLPGFRSIDVTGRYWGFLALPLSLLSAASLWKTAAELRGWRLHVCLGLAMLFQLGFQAETLAARWIHTPVYHEVSGRGYFGNGPEAIDYVAIAQTRTQGEVIGPTRGVCDCYDMDDFVRAQTGPGPDLVLQVTQDADPVARPWSLNGGFASWSRIRLSAGCETNNTAVCTAPDSATIRIVLKQAYHSNWRAAGCETHASPRGNLTLDCPAPRLRALPVELTFRDVVSDAAAQVSILAWQIWLWAAAGALVLQCGLGLRTYLGNLPTRRLV